MPNPKTWTAEHVDSEGRAFAVSPRDRLAALATVNNPVAIVAEDLCVLMLAASNGRTETSSATTDRFQAASLLTTRPLGC